MPATFKLTLHFPLPPTLAPSTVLRALHAYEPLITPNPYLHSFSRLPVDLAALVADPFFREDDGFNIMAYEIHDRIPILGRLASKDVRFPATFQSFPAGVRLRADAAAGTRVHSVYEVVVVDDAAGWELRETSVVECNPLLKGFVQKSFEAGHRDLGRRVLEELMERRQKELPPLPGADAVQ